MSEAETTPKTDPPIDVKPTITKDEATDPKETKIPQVIHDQLKNLITEVKGLRAAAKKTETDRLVVEATEKRNSKLVELKKVNKTLYEKYKDETDITKIEQAIEDAPLIKKGFPKLIEDAKKDDKNKIPTGKNPFTGKIEKH